MNPSDLKIHYDQLYHESMQAIKSDRYQVDPLIDAPDDLRYGLTLLLRPDERVKREMDCFLARLHAIDPGQYYYPPSDLHVTLLSVISCYDGFTLSQIVAEDYIRTVRESITGAGSFTLEFRGLTASPSCLMVQGFPQDNGLHLLRDRLRVGIAASGLAHSMDQRYLLQTAHATIVRLKEQLKNREEYLQCIEAYRDHPFGTCRVGAIELVGNDWYQRQKSVQPLARFEL